MPRTKNSATTSAKRTEILFTFQRLLYQKGYDNVSIQDVLTELQMSKGALYHYFSSKESILESLVAKMLDDARPHILATVAHEQTPIKRMNALFAVLGQWKLRSSKEVVALLAGWYSDGNVIVRYKLRAKGGQEYIPLLESCIEEGIARGDFTAQNAAQLAQIIYVVLCNISDQSALILLDTALSVQEKWIQIDKNIQVHTTAIERMLQAPEMSLVIVEREVLDQWKTLLGE